MAVDAEIKAMSTILDSLESLDPEARQRVLAWIARRLGTTIPGSTLQPESSIALEASRSIGDASGDGRQGLSSYSALPDAFSASGPPETAPQRALVVAAYMHVVEGKEELTGFDVNKELKHLGYAVANITQTMEALVRARPQLIVQTRKTGSGKQTRKAYRVTAQGIKIVEGLLTGLEVTSNNTQ